jgi:hypothetical protein
MGKKDKQKPKQPFVTICTPTFNRRPFIPIMLKCFDHQTYPKDRIEWLILDDGTDKIEDLVKHVPQVRYLAYNEKMTLGRKRNILNDNAKGDIILYMDDDDYYPPERISHAVEMLQKNPKALCAGSSELFIYFKHIRKMYKFGPYGPNHSTAATFAYRRELLSKTRYDESSSIAEEKHFLKNYTVPFVQLDTKKSIMVFSHIHNSFDKKELLKQMPNPNIHETIVKPTDIVKEEDILKFFMEDIDLALAKYEPGSVQNKPDVTAQIKRITEERMKMIEDHNNKQREIQDIVNRLQIPANPQEMVNRIIEMSKTIENLSQENGKLKEKASYYEDKLRQLISEKVQQRANEKSQLDDLASKKQGGSEVEKRVSLSNTGPVSISIL